MFLLSEAASHVLLTASIFLTLAVSLSMKKAKGSGEGTECEGSTKSLLYFLLLYLFPCYTLSMAINIPKILTFFFNTKFLLKFFLSFRFFHPLFTTIIVPGSFLVFINSNINSGFLNNKRIRSVQNRKKSSSFSSMLIVVFLLCSVPRVVESFIEIGRTPSILKCLSVGLNYYASTTQWMFDILSRYFSLLNSSLYFIIFFTMKGVSEKSIRREI